MPIYFANQIGAIRDRDENTHLRHVKIKFSTKYVALIPCLTWTNESGCHSITKTLAPSEKCLGSVAKRLPSMSVEGL